MPATDDFENKGPNLMTPATRLEAITPDDSNDITRVTRAINVAVAGAVKVTTVGGDEVAVYIAAGVAFPLRAVRVWATGTDATGIVGLS